MVGHRWFPIRHHLGGENRLGDLLFSNGGWQIYRINKFRSILVAHKSLADKWVESNLIDDTEIQSLDFGDSIYMTIESGENQRIEPSLGSSSPNTKQEALDFALSIRETRKISATAPLQDSIYIERISRLLPTWTVSQSMSDEEILGRWLTGGIPVRASSFRQLTKLLGWLEEADVREILEAARIKPTKCTGNRKKFCLPGRPLLESFFQEHIIDLINNAEQYAALGIKFPTAIALHGPPGCGKTYAVERLAEHLGWPIFYVESGSVASPLIHETSKMISKVFDKAEDAAPSMIVIDEMESYLSERLGSHGDHIEEIAEFLHRIPEASKNKVLVVGMTNCIEIIDKAVLRRGRFDHVLKVGMPKADEVLRALESILKSRPTSGNIDLSNIAKSLEGRPLSDCAFLVDTAAKLAVQARKNSIDNSVLQDSLASLPPSESQKPESPRGFRPPGLNTTWT